MYEKHFFFKGFVLAIKGCFNDEEAAISSVVFSSTCDITLTHIYFSSSFECLVYFVD